MCCSYQVNETLLSKKFYLELQIKINNSSGRGNAIIRNSTSLERLLSKRTFNLGNAD